MKKKYERESERCLGCLDYLNGKCKMEYDDWYRMHIVSGYNCHSDSPEPRIEPSKSGFGKFEREWLKVTYELRLKGVVA